MKKLRINNIINSLTITEKALVYSLLFIFLASAFYNLLKVSNKFSVEVPERGGRIEEGIIGSPRLINPLLAVSETDKALVALTYSGLLRFTSDGLINDLAEGYTVSENLMEYSFTIKQDAVFHDGTEVTADDVVFTINSAKNPNLKSLKRANWEGIQVEKINDKEVLFTLNEPYTPFLQNMTIGILPKHIWGDMDVNEFSINTYNINPIGSGPYKVSKINRDSIGIPSSYTLEPFKSFVLGEPMIKKIILRFAKNQEELLGLYNSGQIDSAYGIGPRDARRLRLSGEEVEDFPLPRIFALFINQSENPVLNKNHVRRALDLATPKTKIIDSVLYGFATTISGPIPHGILKPNDYVELSAVNAPEGGEISNIEKASILLEENGWEINEDGFLIREDGDEKEMLNVTITTSNIPELAQMAEIIAESWRSIGITTEIQSFNPTDLSSGVIRPRNFEALLFGLVIGREMDFYAFWHSSQRVDPGLNITGYANIDVDSALVEIRSTDDTDIRDSNLKLIQKEIMEDIPAIFLYSPNFIYISPKGLKGLKIDHIITPEERFLEIYKWYFNTNKIWEFLLKK